MPNFSLWPFGRQNPSTTQDTSDRHARPKVKTAQPAPSEDAPPKYTTISANHAKLSISATRPGGKARQALHEVEWRGPAEGAKPSCARVQLNRYILEIIALTFHADFDALNNALHGGDGNSGTNTILTGSERTTLTSLSHAVANAKRWMDAEYPIPATDRDYLLDAIIVPAGLSCFADFSLDLVHWYGGTLSYPVPWGQTIPGIFAINDITFTPRYSVHPHGTFNSIVDEKPKESMGAFLQAIYTCSPNAKVQAVLKDAFDDCRLRLAYGAVKKSVLYSPVREGYTELLGVIKLERMKLEMTLPFEEWRL